MIDLITPDITLLGKNLKGDVSVDLFVTVSSILNETDIARHNKKHAARNRLALTILD